MSTPVIRQAVAVSTSGTNATVTLGAGTAVGDLLIIVHSNDWATLAELLTPTSSQTISNMSLVVTADNGSLNTHIKVWSGTITVAGSQTVTCNVTAAGEELCNHCIVIDGTTVNTAAFLDGTPQAGGSTTNATAMVAPAVSPTTADALLLCAVQDDGQGAVTTYTPPSGMTEQTDVNPGGFCGGSTASKNLTASGSTGTQTFTASRTGNYSTVSLAVMGGAVTVDPGPGELQIAPGVNGPGGVFLNIPAIDTVAAPATTASAEETDAAFTAYDASTALTANAGTTTVTFSALDAAASAGANAETTTAAFTAYDATVSTAAATNAPAETTAVTWTGFDAAAAAGPNAETTTASLTAYDATASVGGAADTTTASWTAYDASAALAPAAGTTTATWTAQDPLAALGVNAETIVVTFTAYDATVSTASVNNAPAETTTATWTALDATASIAPNAETTVVTWTALDASAALGVPAGTATAAFTAQDATVQVGQNASGGVANASWTALDASVTAQTGAGQASAAFAAFDASVAASGGVRAFGILDSSSAVLGQLGDDGATEQVTTGEREGGVTYTTGEAWS